MTLRFNLAISLPANFLKTLLQRLFLLLGCLHLIGGPHSIVQIYAWANMLVSYSQETGFTQAARDTFSGEKPCTLCNKIAAVKADESRHSPEKPPLAPLAQKLFHDLFPTVVATLKDPRSSPLAFHSFSSPCPLLSAAANGPATPPPRC